MNKNIGDMTKSELIDFIIELQEENSRYERKNEKYKEVFDKLRKKCNLKKDRYDYKMWLKLNESWKTLNDFAEHIKYNLHSIITYAYQCEIKNSIKEIIELTKYDAVLKDDILDVLKEVE